MNKEIVEVVNGEVCLPDPICPIIPMDIHCKTYNYTITSDKRKLSAKSADGTKISYDDISPFYATFENVKDDKGNEVLIHFVQGEEAKNNQTNSLFGKLNISMFR